jgi:prepilin-type N-terminal cleavage/methylation domain-containing protein
MKQKRVSQKGFTLIEIVVVIGIMAIAYSSFFLFGFGAKNSLRQESRNLVQTIRYVYQIASLNSLYYRIVFDFETNEYFIESSEEPIFVKKQTEDDEEKEQNSEDEEDDSKDQDADEDALIDDTAEFAEAEDDLFERHKLDADLKFYSLYVDHQRDKKEWGQVYLTFFPRGQTQFAVIQLADQEEENFMTLEVNPMTGNVTVYDGVKGYAEILEELQN